jgi:molybdate transport system substrate-binding protein
MVDMMRKLLTLLAVIMSVTLLGSASVEAADLRVLASNGVKAAVEELKPQLEKASGGTVSIDFSTTAALRERIEKGEAFDVAILTDDAIDVLIKAGKLSQAQRAKLARVGIGVGYRKGTPKPDVGTASSIKQALLDAKSIAYTEAGASRPGIDRMFGQLGIAGQLHIKSHLTAAGAAPASVGKGESDLVLTLISEILPEPGVALAGPIPSEFQTYIGFSAAPSPKTAASPAAAAVIKFLDSPTAAAIYKAKGMEAIP